jgi:predicted nucleotide-binding protein
MNDNGFDALKGFLKGARGRSQEDIIIEFLDAVINVGKVSESGSVLINHPRSKKLVLFNEGNFLFTRGLLDPKNEWKGQFGYYDGVAARCFRLKEPTRYCKQDETAAIDFFGNSPIENMVCIPIRTTSGGDPFGVVCFHNNDPQRKFDDDDVARLESYVDVLAIALHTPHPELQLERNVFIVHGADKSTLNELQLMLIKHGVNPKVLDDENKNAQYILKALEDLLRVCKAGFILATPDDEGRPCGSESELKQRAQENVIFEMGLLFAKYREFERVAVLLRRPLQLPADLEGIACESFTNIGDIETKIVNKLTKWGLVQSSQRSVTGL